MKTTKVNLAALINISARLLERGKSLSIEEAEKAIIEKEIIELLQRKFDSSIDLVTFSPEFDTQKDQWNEINTELNHYLKSEYNPHAPGQSGKKWGVKDGLTLIIALSAEVLRDSN